MSQAAPHPLVTIEHVKDGQYVIRAVQDRNGVLPDWIKIGANLSAADTAELLKVYGEGSVRDDANE